MAEPRRLSRRNPATLCSREHSVPRSDRPRHTLRRDPRKPGLWRSDVSQALEPFGAFEAFPGVKITRRGSAFGPGPGVKVIPPDSESRASPVGGVIASIDSVVDGTGTASPGPSTKVLGTMGTPVPGEKLKP